MKKSMLIRTSPNKSLRVLVPIPNPFQILSPISIQKYRLCIYLPMICRHKP